MENNYYTPDIEDIRVGYECEIKEKGEWFPKTLYRTNEVSHVFWTMSQPKMDGAQIRTPYLTKEQIEAEGFVLKAKSIDHWFEIKEELRFDTDLHMFCGYKAYNVFLNYGFHDHRLHIKADFSGGEKYDKAECLFDGECKSINELRQILKSTHITPFYTDKNK